MRLFTYYMAEIWKNLHNFYTKFSNRFGIFYLSSWFIRTAWTSPIVLHFSLSLSLFFFLSTLFLPTDPHRSHAHTNRTIVVHNFDFTEDKSQFVYVSLEDQDRLSVLRMFRFFLPCPPFQRFTADPDSADIKSNSVVYLSRTLSYFFFIFFSFPLSSACPLYLTVLLSLRLPYRSSFGLSPYHLRVVSCIALSFSR